VAASLRRRCRGAARPALAFAIAADGARRARAACAGGVRITAVTAAVPTTAMATAAGFGLCGHVSRD
jgi:hypothetical protein